MPRPLGPGKCCAAADVPAPAPALEREGERDPAAYFARVRGCFSRIPRPKICARAEPACPPAFQAVPCSCHMYIPVEMCPRSRTRMGLRRPLEAGERFDSPCRLAFVLSVCESGGAHVAMCV